MAFGNAATIGIVTSVFGALFVVLALIAAAFLLRAYTRTRMSALIWMLLAIVVWPILTRILFVLTPFLVQSRALGVSEYMTLNLLEVGISSLVSGSLLVISCLLLDRQLSVRTQAGQNIASPARYATAPPTYPPYNGGRAL